MGWSGVTRTFSARRLADEGWKRGVLQRFRRKTPLFTWWSCVFPVSGYNEEKIKKAMAANLTTCCISLSREEENG
jgi:hypothetical protein